MWTEQRFGVSIENLGENKEPGKKRKLGELVVLRG